MNAVRTCARQPDFPLGGRRPCLARAPPDPNQARASRSAPAARRATPTSAPCRCSRRPATSSTTRAAAASAASSRPTWRSDTTRPRSTPGSGAAFDADTVTSLFATPFGGGSTGVDVLTRMLREATEEQSFSDTVIPLIIMAVDLTDRVPAPQREGPLWDALLAALAVAGVFPPVERDGHRLVDGLALVPVPTGVGGRGRRGPRGLGQSHGRRDARAMAGGARAEERRRAAAGAGCSTRCWR